MYKVEFINFAKGIKFKQLVFGFAKLFCKVYNVITIRKTQFNIFAFQSDFPDGSKPDLILAIIFAIVLKFLITL